MKQSRGTNYSKRKGGVERYSIVQTSFFFFFLAQFTLQSNYIGACLRE